MGIEANYIIYQNETGAVIDIESDNNGTIIGRRGETLDSIQYLCSIIANKGDKDYFRITIDCLGYRNKRKETLEQLAAKVAKSVIRTGRSQQLEPMNPYERRVIHSAVSNIEGVASRSVGEEPYRKIIISSTNPRNNRNNSRGRGPRRDDRRGRNGGRDRRRENFEAKAIDLSTSFEKDYKKPKPEDSMEGGLYGKIEF
jgi:spoIIIJ-associated protein